MTGLNWRSILILSAAVASISCESFQGMGTLRRELVEEFQSPDVVLVRASNGSLTVTLQNPFPDLDERATCRRIAEFVRDHFDEYRTLRTVRVGFATRHRVVAGIEVTRTRTVCSFTRGELGEPPSTSH